MTQPFLDGPHRLIINPNYGSAPEMAQVPGGMGSGGGFLPNDIASSRGGHSYIDPHTRSAPFQPPYMAPQNVFEGTNPYASYVNRNSRPSSDPRESVHYHPGEGPPHSSQHSNFPSPISVRYFTPAESLSNGSSSRDHIPLQQPFVVMQEHPVPLWDRYVSVHPFQSRNSVSSASLSPNRSLRPIILQSHLPPPISYNSTSSPLTVKHVLEAGSDFLFDSLPRRLYLSLLLGLPSLYFTRVARVFEDAELSKPDIRKMVHATANEWEGRPTTMNWNYTTQLSPALLTFKRSWEEFVDSLMREWKTLNVVSVLLLSAILTVLQIQGAETDPVTRTAALMSLVCALMSLAYGCMYIVRFGTMKKMHKASSWADEARKTDTLIWWNVWVLLAMPAVWLAWSMTLFLLCILSFVWRTGSTLDPAQPSPLTPHVALGVRVGISALLALGLLYALMIVQTLTRYGARMDEAWTNRALAWQLEDVPRPPVIVNRTSRSNSIHQKDEAIYGTRTQAQLYRPPRDNISPRSSPRSIPVGLPGSRTPRGRTPDDLNTADRPLTGERSALFSTPMVPNPINNLPMATRPPTPPAAHQVFSSQIPIIPPSSTPVPPDSNSTSEHNIQLAQPDNAPAIPSCFFRPANRAASQPIFTSITIDDDMANFRENEHSTPWVLLHYGVSSDEWSRFAHDLSLACAGRFPVSEGVSIIQSDLIADLVDVWNDAFFKICGVSVSIEGRSVSPSTSGETTKYTLYLHCAWPEEPVREFNRSNSRLSVITERTEQTSLDNAALGMLRSLPLRHGEESAVSRPNTA